MKIRLRELSGWLLVVALAGLQTGCFTEKVWQNNGVGVTELQFPFPEGWIKGQADGDNEYVIVSYNTVPRHVAISLGSKKNPSIYRFAGDAPDEGGSENSFQAPSVHALGVTADQIHAVAGTTLDSEAMPLADKLMSDPSYRTLDPVEIGDSPPTSDHGDDEQKDWVDFPNNGEGVAVFRIGVGGQPGRKGYDPAHTRVVLIPTNPKVPSQEQVGRTTVAVLLTPLAVAADVVTSPIQLLSIISFAVNPAAMGP